MVKCLTSIRFSLTADILRPIEYGEESVPLSEQGHHAIGQDPWTGEIIRDWGNVVNDDGSVFSIKCDIRGVLDGGIRVAGTTERFDKIYENVDFAHMGFSSKYVLTNRDRVTNVREKSGNIIWVEEELDLIDGKYPSTIFNVLGVTPITDYAGRHIENRALLARADLNDY